MPFLHLDANNWHKEDWYELVKDHPCHFEVLEWSRDQDRDLIQRSYPDIDTQLYPKFCIALGAGLQKLVDYGGIVVRGEDVAPIRGVKILLNDWRTLGPPKKLTMRGYAYPVNIFKTTIMASAAGDEICKSYRDKVVEMLKIQSWTNPDFGGDVALM